MPNKYSHALVLSHYESRGLISFPERHKPRPTNTEPSHSERKRKKKEKAHPSSRAAGVPSNPPLTPLPPLPPSPCPPTTRDENAVPSSSHRSTPSIVTEIYVPDQPSVPSQNPLTLQSASEPEEAQISPVTTTGNSLTSETSYSLEATPRTSVSSVRDSTGQGGDKTGNDKPLPPPPPRSSNNHEASQKLTSDGGVEQIPNRATSPEKGADRIDDTSEGVRIPPSLPPVRIIQSPPKPLSAFVDDSKPHSFYYIDNCSTRLLDDGAGTPPILRLPFHPPPGSSGSSSPDDAAPPPISRHRRQIAPTIKKSDQLEIWTKPATTDRGGRRAPSLTIRDLTPEVTPWEEFTAVASGHLNSMRSEAGKRDSTVLPAKSPVKSVRIATPEVTMDGALVSKKVLRKRISRLRGPTLEPAGDAKNVGAEKLVPRDERALGAIDGRGSMIWSDSDEEFLAQFENDGYFLR